MKHPRLLFISVLAVFAVLVALGTWQLKRLQWKEALIAKIEQRINSPAVSLTDLAFQYKGDEKDYRPVRLYGSYLHKYERAVYALDQQGRPGWHIYTPFVWGYRKVKENGEVFVFVNRGFVPDRLKDPSTRPNGQIETNHYIDGLIRLPAKQGGRFTPENDPAHNIWFWASFNEMRDSLPSGLQPNAEPLFIDLRDADIKSDWPRPGTTRVNLPNRHLEYALTWYGLALALLSVYGFFLYGSRRQSGD
jgi:surfeit locus 1 family protein